MGPRRDLCPPIVTHPSWLQPGPQRDPHGRSWAVALLNPIEFDAGEVGSWLEGSVFEVLMDVLTHTEVNAGVARVRIHDHETGRITHRLTISGYLPLQIVTSSSGADVRSGFPAATAAGHADAGGGQ